MVAQVLAQCAVSDLTCLTTVHIDGVLADVSTTLSLSSECFGPQPGSEPPAVAQEG